MAKTNTIITIGREYGSAGRQIGYKVAEDLGIKLYDREMLERAAKESGICEELLKHTMKNLRTVFCILWLWIPTHSDILHPVIQTCRSIIKFFSHNLIPSARSHRKVLVFLLDVVPTMHWKNLIMS